MSKMSNITYYLETDNRANLCTINKLTVYKYPYLYQKNVGIKMLITTENTEYVTLILIIPNSFIIWIHLS